MCEYEFEFINETCALPSGHEGAHLTKAGRDLIEAPATARYEQQLRRLFIEAGPNDDEFFQPVADGLLTGALVAARDEGRKAANAEWNSKEGTVWHYDCGLDEALQQARDEGRQEAVRLREALERLTRYSVEGYDGEIAESPDGPFVRYEEVAALARHGRSETVEECLVCGDGFDNHDAIAHEMAGRSSDPDPALQTAGEPPHRAEQDVNMTIADGISRCICGRMIAEVGTINDRHWLHVEEPWNREDCRCD